MFEPIKLVRYKNSSLVYRENVDLKKLQPMKGCLIRKKFFKFYY